ncbi:MULTISPECIES: DUF7736 domain-containing protein [Salipiger]|uniref:DUF7736 domain-containing protein n=1 Tax=Salipiger profundus TaxID=1229727 RepID=A0A1U7CZI7_9RHOB|nr:MULTISPECIES: hypothetical protein [Salipiger]ALF02078.1 hypothetical protein vBThpSP1_039 [Thiobacimonas phage vB_ThpS-P1]APX21301.1 hypothetical protein Ga0080559_TMP505 [Salipiger profundus]GGA03413.1 hypothetical protein GCM10011326_13500 [Salipiger profundus]
MSEEMTQMPFETHGVLSATTGILMGDILALYHVVSYLLDRPAYTHELVHYGKGVRAALLTCHPELPSEATSENWKQVRDREIQKWGDTMELDPALKGVLADDKDPVSTLREMGFGGAVITVDLKLS